MTGLDSEALELGVWPYAASAWAGEGVVPFGESVLHTKTQPVESISSDIERLAGYMLDVMHERAGIGLAANQVGSNLRMFVHNFPKVAPQVIINPVVVKFEGEWAYEEGCLSLSMPDTRATVVRPKLMTVEALSLDGRRLRIAADEMLARVFMHEIDHLDGYVYVQRLKGEARKSIYRKMKESGVTTSMLNEERYDSVSLSKDLADGNSDGKLPTST